MNRTNRSASTSRVKNRELTTSKYKKSVQKDKTPCHYSTDKSEDKFRNRRSLSSSSSSRSSLSTHRSLPRKRKMAPSRLFNRRQSRRPLSKSRTTSQLPRRRSHSEKSPSALGFRKTNRLRIKPPRPLHKRNVSPQNKTKSKSFDQKRNRQSSEKTSSSGSNACMNSQYSMSETTSLESSISPISTSGSNRRTDTRYSKKGVSSKNDRKYTPYRSEKISSSSAETYNKSEPCIKSKVYVKSKVCVKSVGLLRKNAAVQTKQVPESQFRSRSSSVPRHLPVDTNSKTGQTKSKCTKSLARPVSIKTEQDKKKISHKKKNHSTKNWASYHKPFETDLITEINKPSVNRLRLSDRFGRLARLGPRVQPQQETFLDNDEAGSELTRYPIRDTETRWRHASIKGRNFISKNQRRF